MDLFQVEKIAFKGCIFLITLSLKLDFKLYNFFSQFVIFKL
jgi:hypothetical protein